MPCRIGLSQLETLIESVLDQTAPEGTIDLIESTAAAIADSADCAIGYEAAAMVLEGVRGFREDYEEHAHNGRCHLQPETAGALRDHLPRPCGHPRLHRPGAGGPL